MRALKTFKESGVKYWGKNNIETTVGDNVVTFLEKSRASFLDKLFVVCSPDFLSHELMRSFALWCAINLERYMIADESKNALLVARNFILKEASSDDLEAARVKASNISYLFFNDNKSSQTLKNAALAAACVCNPISVLAARDTSWTCSQDVPVTEQEAQLKRMILAGVDTGDTLWDTEDARENKRRN